MTLRARIIVKGGRLPEYGDGPLARGQDIGVQVEIDGRRYLLPVTSLVLRVDGRKALAVCEIAVDEIDLIGIKLEVGAHLAPPVIDEHEAFLERWESVKRGSVLVAKCRRCGFECFAGADASIEDHDKACKEQTK